MSGHHNGDEQLLQSRNTSRFCIDNRQIAWVFLIGTAIWGWFSYNQMPQRKDPEIPLRIAVVLTAWPGASAERIEQLVTKKVEQKVAENATVTEIKSISRTSISIVTFALDQKVGETGKELDDIKLKLDNVRDLPDGAGPIYFIKDFGDTATLMLTVASPKASEQEIAVRARAVRAAIESVRAQSLGGNRIALVQNFAYSRDPRVLRRAYGSFRAWAASRNDAKDMRSFDGPGFFGLDMQIATDEAGARELLQHYLRERMQIADFHPDDWEQVAIKNPADTVARLTEVAGDKYSYRELEQYTGLIEKTMKAVPVVSKVTRSGVLDEAVYLTYSQERLASYGVSPSNLPNILRARNITLAGGIVDVDGKNLVIDPSGEFKSEKEIGDVVIGASPAGAPLYLRDLVDIVRDYQSPARYLNYYLARDAKGEWKRTRAVTVAIQMRAGEQIAAFSKAVDEALADIQDRLPPDLILARTSDQPKQVTENVSLFMRCLYEAILLVVLVSFVGFWEWRSAVLMALAIPITLAMTYGMMHLLHIDLQQVSIATLIIALGLLIDDPVVAGDAIKRELAAGHKRSIAAWLGPTRLANAILYATITNIVAYLPFLMLGGDAGRFLRSLPIVITCSLVASRIVSMTFIPLLGYYLLRPKREPSIEERRARGFARWYYGVGTLAIRYRWLCLVGSIVVLVLAFRAAGQLKTQFFPMDLAPLSYVDVWLPEDASLAATNESARQAERIIQRVADDYRRSHPVKEKDGPALPVLKSLTTFLGGGGPRFWFSVSPELLQLNYAQVLIEVHDKHDTGHLVPLLQQALSEGVPGARVDVRQLETSAPVGVPVAVQLSGDEIPVLRAQAERIKNVFRALPKAERVRDDWGEDNFTLKLNINADRANLAGITNLDIAAASASGINGLNVAVLREGDKQIPVLAKLRMEQRSMLSDINSLYVYSYQDSQRVPLGQVSTIGYQMQTEKLRRVNHFRTVTVGCFPIDGALPSELLAEAMPKLLEIQRTMPAGYKLDLAGESKVQEAGFKELAIVMLISITGIFFALVLQFKSAVKPFLVFAAIPFGIAGALAALRIMGSPFGFMAFLGVSSLVGVIVSHIIVLFDFIEERREEGEPLQEALLDAGILRLRPVLITVGATIIGLLPLAEKGGPLWEPLCYTQIGGLLAATFITLLLVPVLYAIFVLDLKIVKWETSTGAKAAADVI